MALDGAAAAQSRKTFGEIGVSGLKQFSGYIHEETLSELSGTRWRDTLKRMLANDSTINSLNFAIEMMCRQVSWSVTPADATPEAEELAAFYSDALFERMATTWQDTLGEIVSFISWGWAVHEIVYERRADDGRIGWKRFAGRSQDSLSKWIFDNESNAIAMVQDDPNTGTDYTIPMQKCLHFRTSTAKNNPEGRSIYRGAYRPWYFKSRIENIEAIGTERDLAGLPVMYVPESIMRVDASSSEVALRNSLKSVLTSIRRDESEGVMMPALHDENGNKLFELKLLSTGGQRQFNTDAIIGRYKAEILSVALADFMVLGSQTATGSYALSTDKTQMFATALEAFLDTIVQQFNVAFRTLGKLNGFNPDLVPKLNHGQVDKIAIGELFAALQAMSGAGFTFDPAQQNWFKSQINAPADADQNEA